MSSESAVAYVSVIPAAKGFGTKLSSQIDGQNVGATISQGLSKSFLSTVGGIAKTTAKVLGGGVAAAVGGIGAVAATKGLGRLLDIEDAQAKLKGLGHDGKSVATIMDSALASVKGTAFGLGDAAGVAASAVAAGIKPGQDLTKYLKLTADAAVIAGTSLSDMGSIINKTTTSGKVYTDNLNQLADRGIPIFQWLQKEYGVSADELSDMVRKGQVDSATFRKVIQENIGGAALSAADTNRGAMANVGAALGRLGAQFLKGSVASGPKLFQAISNATDRAGKSLTPYSDKINGALTTGIQRLTGWIDRLDFDKVVKGIAGVFRTLQSGSAVGSGLDIAQLFGLDKVAGIERVLIGLHDGVAGVFSAMKSGDASKFPATLGTIGSIVKPLLPFFLQVAKGLGSISGAAGQVVASGLPLLVPILKSFSDILGFLGDHTEILTPLIVTLAGAFLVYKTAQAAANIATLASIPVQVTRTAALFASAAANNALADATLLAAGAERQGLIARLPATVAVVASTAAKVASTVATGAATAAQWLFNAALTANPIGIIIVAIAALVAGLIYFFTQTKAGQAAWAAFTMFLGTAWEVIKALFTAGIAVVSALWTGLWTFVTAYASAYLAIVTTVVRGALGLVRAIFTAGVMAVRGVWQAGLNFVVAIARAVFAGVVAVVSGNIGIVKTVIGAGLAIIKAIFTGNFGAIPGIVSGAVGRVVSIVGGMVSGVRTALSGVVTAVSNLKSGVLGALSGAGSWLVEIGRNIIQGLINGVTGIAGNLGAAVSRVVNSIPAVVKKLLGIHSPSRVMMALGQFVTQGFAKGITGSSKQITSAMQSLSNKVANGFNTKIVTKKLVKAATKTTKAVYKTISTPVVSARQNKSIQSWITQDNKKLQRLAAQRLVIADKIKKASQKLTDATKTRNDFAASVASKVVDSGDVTKFSTATSAIDNLRARVADTKKFASVLAKLRKGGLDDTSYAQFAAAGVDALPMAQSLLSAGGGKIRQVAALQKQLTTAASALGTATSRSLYQAGVDSAKGIVQGLKSQDKELSDAMGSIATKLVGKIKKMLGIHSPSKVFELEVGQQIGAGLLKGIDSTASAVADSVGNLVDVPSLDTSSYARQISSGSTYVSDPFPTYAPGAEPNTGSTQAPLTVHVTNKTGVALGDLIDIHIQQNDQKKIVDLRTGLQKNRS
ncbi:tape measure protein [Frondihabitans sp. VKM Ac-2883]|uniref:tape measure protein n=1 Tax=Frondihabitans sp. VKM Ac-2883 TaxID=2783823 RepID=UPI00188C3FED|nr:tape measure protein [Frondihabitans sp. VKM Ac-2883]MBF4574672.1 tape measure protein [Frondihabitans sp. VKM Ac-2883]